MEAMRVGSRVAAADSAESKGMGNPMEGTKRWLGTVLRKQLSLTLLKKLKADIQCASSEAQFILEARQREVVV